MDGLHVMRRLAHNEAWANHRLHAAVARLDADAYHLSTRTSFFPSIHQTLAHILYVGLFYVDALTGGGRGRSLWPDYERCMQAGRFDEVREAQAELDQRLMRWLDAVRPDALDVPVHIERKDRVQVELAGDVLLHLFQHQIHHRGQVHAMLAGTDVAPPQLDEFFLGDELSKREHELRALGLPLV